MTITPIHLHPWRRRGFTLLELIVVLVVLGLLAAVAIPSYRAITNNAAIKSHEARDLAVAMRIQAGARLEGHRPISSIIEEALSETPTTASTATGIVAVEVNGWTLGEADPDASTNQNHFVWAQVGSEVVTGTRHDAERVVECTIPLTGGNVACGVDQGREAPPTTTTTTTPPTSTIAPDGTDCAHVHSYTAVSGTGNFTLSPIAWVPGSVRGCIPTEFVAHSGGRALCPAFTDPGSMTGFVRSTADYTAPFVNVHYISETAVAAGEGCVPNSTPLAPGNGAWGYPVGPLGVWSACPDGQRSTMRGHLTAQEGALGIAFGDWLEGDTCTA